MATLKENVIQSMTVIAGEDLSAGAHRFVKLSSGKIVYCDAGEQALGVLLHNVANNGVGKVGLKGTFKVLAGGNVTECAAVEALNDGKVQAKASGISLGLGLKAVSANSYTYVVM